MEHSKMYQKIYDYYNGTPQLWNRKRVHDALLKGKITQEEYEEIINAKEGSEGGEQ